MRYLWEELSLKTSLEKKKGKLKQVTLFQEDCQAFGNPVDKAHSLEDAFQYHLTSVPLRIAEASVD